MCVCTYLWHIHTYKRCIICICHIDIKVRYNICPHKDIPKYEISHPVTIVKCFFLANIFNKIFKSPEMSKEFDSEQPYAYHLDSMTNILLYLLYHM